MSKQINQQREKNKQEKLTRKKAKDKIKSKRLKEQKKKEKQIAKEDENNDEITLIYLISQVVHVYFSDFMILLKTIGDPRNDKTNEGDKG